MKKLTQSFNRTTLVVGETFEIELAAASGGGYLWQAENLPDHVTLVGSRYKLHDYKKHHIGSHATQVFTLKAARPGDILLTMVHQRPWNKEAIDSCTFNLQIKPSP